MVACLDAQVLDRNARLKLHMRCQTPNIIVTKVVGHHL